MAAAPSLFACIENRKLLSELIDAMSAITRLQDAQMQDLINGGSGLPRIDLALKAARRDWDKIRRAYLAHLAEHGC